MKMLKKCLGIFIITTFIVCMMALNASAVTIQVTFSARTTSNTYIPGSTLEIYNGSGTCVLNQTMSTGYLTVNMTGGETIYYNVRASNYAAGWEQYTVPTSGTGICYRNLISKSTYTAYQFQIPLSVTYTLVKIGSRKPPARSFRATVPER